jgi:drug/metabolite transporter (DMT)-like permease
LIYFVLVIQTLIASGTHIVAKVVVQDVDSYTLTFLRAILAAAAFFIVFMVREKRIRIERQDIARIIWLGVLAIPINQFAFLVAIGYTTPPNAALFYATTPVFVMLFSSWLLNERTGPVAKVGIIIGFVGIATVILERGLDFRSEYMHGNALLLLAVSAWGLYTVQGKPLIIKYGSFHVSALTMIVGAIVYIPIGIIPAVRFDYTVISAQHIYGIIYLGIGTSVLAYFLWYYALGRIESTRVAVFTYLQPVLTTIMAVFFLRQIISTQFIVGAAIAILGVVLVQRAPSIERLFLSKEQ